MAKLKTNTKFLKENSELVDCVEIALKAAKKNGATSAEASLGVDAGISVTVRNGSIETMEYHQDKGLGITVYIEKSKGSASTSDLSSKAIKETVKVATDIARFTAGDEFAGIAEEDDLAWDYPDLDLYHPWGISADDAVDLAIDCEKAAMKFDKRIVNSEGASVSSHESFHVYGNSHGFTGAFPSSSQSLSCSVIAKSGDIMQRDYWFTATRDSSLMEDAKKVGKKAAKRTIARLDAQKIPTGKSPVIFVPEMAAGLISHFINAIRGANLYRKSSFLLDALDEKIFPEWMHIYEQPHIVGGIGSAPYDGEGVITRSKNIVAEGVLTSYILDSYSAKKLGMKTTGNAGGVHNLIVEPGENSFNSILSSMDKGLVVTELMGQGVNTVTGDYSRGAAGYWVEKGKIKYPVEEITIASNLKDMFRQIVCVGNDIDTRRNTRTPSIFIEEMTVAGN